MEFVSITGLSFGTMIHINHGIRKLPHMQNTVSLSEEQESIVLAPLHTKIFLQGYAGTGKTTAAVHRYLSLIESGIPAERILILVPQRTLGFPYYKAIHQIQENAGGMPDILTFGGLARRSIGLFWQLVSGEAGFSSPDDPPQFLTMETAQYYMSSILQPLLDQGYFETAKVDIHRLASQILDNLNKTAVIGIDHQGFGEILQFAWVGRQDQLRLYADAQEVANLFRRYCLEHNLLDFSLQIEIFTKYLWPLELCRDYLRNRYQVLIYDNLEEDIPPAHDLIRTWLPSFSSALLIYDLEGGFRAFLGADPSSGYSLKDNCDRVVHYAQSFVNSVQHTYFQNALASIILHNSPPVLVQPNFRLDIDSVMNLSHAKFVPDLINLTCDHLARLVIEEGIPPGEIVVLSPYLSDALRFAVGTRLSALGIPFRTLRPSRSLIDEPAVRCLLTLVKIAHPSWGVIPNHFELRYALMQAIEDVDLVRADLLSRIVFRKNVTGYLSSFDRIQNDKQERITYRIGQRFEYLRRWLLSYIENEAAPLDIFITRLFGEVLSQPGYGFHADLDAVDAAARLVESIQKFRLGVYGGDVDRMQLGKEYLQTIQSGLLAAQYPQSWTSVDENAVLISPAYTYLMSNRPVQYQFWLDIGNLGWWERLHQPLTNPHVLSRHWNLGEKWTDVQEYQHNQETMVRLVTGLIRRCRKKIYLYAVGIDEQGNEDRGPLLRAVQTLRQRVSRGVH